MCIYIYIYIYIHTHTHNSNTLRKTIRSRRKGGRRAAASREEAPGDAERRAAEVLWG